jgi:hypothetical protein
MAVIAGVGGGGGGIEPILKISKNAETSLLVLILGI